MGVPDNKIKYVSKHGQSTSIKSKQKNCMSLPVKMSLCLAFKRREAFAVAVEYRGIELGAIIES